MMDILGLANCGVTLLYRGSPLSEVKLDCHGPVETTELVNSEGPLRDFLL